MKQQIRSYGIIALGSLIFALAFDLFYIPNAIALGGATGLAQVINYLVPILPVGLISLLINVPLFIVGWRVMGFRLLATSLYSMAISSVAIDLFNYFIPFAPMNQMLACLCGGAMLGLGLGMVLSQGATTGGTDVVARLLKLKFPWLPMGKLVLIPDVAVLVAAAITFGQLETALYGGVALVVTTHVIDTVLYGLDSSKVAYVISDQWQAISCRLMEEQNRGVTVLQGMGGYTGEEKKVLLVAFKQKEIVEIKRLVHEVDGAAFFIVCDAHEVLGKGFRQYQKEEL